MTDATKHFQSLIDEAITTDPGGRRWGGIVWLPEGVYEISDPLRIHNVRGLRVYGDRTRLVGTMPDRPIFELAGNHCVLGRMDLTTTVHNTAGAIVVASPPNPGPSGWISTANRIVDVCLPHTGGQGFRYGINFDSGILGGSTQNNEHHLVDRLILSNYTFAGVRINGGQIHGVTFRDCHFNDDDGRAQYGILGEYGNYWDWDGGSVSRHSEYDFLLLDFVIRCSIRNVNSELSRRFLGTGGPTGVPLPISINGVRWDGQPLPGDRVITYLSRGPLEVANAQFTAINGNPCRILSYPPADMDGGSVSFRNTVLGQYGGDYAPLECPIQVGEDQEVDEHGLAYRWVRPGRDDVHPFKVQWPADPSRLAIALPSDLQTSYRSEQPAAVVDLAGADFMRGWTVSATATFRPGTLHQQVLSLFDDNGEWICMVWCLHRNQWRIEGPGMAVHLPVAAVPDGVPQRIVAGYDYERNMPMLSVNGVQGTGSSSVRLKAPASIHMAANWADDVRFDGTIDLNGLWGRCLTSEESLVAQR